MPLRKLEMRTRHHTAARKRVVLIVLDGAGIGAAPDADAYGDTGADTLGHIRKTCGISLPNLASLGLGNLMGLAQRQHRKSSIPRAYGIVREASAGKDTIVGHWEIAGLITETPFPVFPNGFPAGLIAELESKTGKRFLGNVSASGTEIIERLGKAHLHTGNPIVYTSADSVFQIAAHGQVMPANELYRICRCARELLTGELGVSRVIARPFSGEPGGFTRTDGRRDFSILPCRETLLDHIMASGHQVIGIGKIDDIFSGRGLTRALHTGGNAEGFQKIMSQMREVETGLIFANLVDFDALYGHRRDPSGFAAALEAFDARVPELLGSLRPGDTLFITADHGNDPTFHGSDHTRELVPLLAAGRGLPPEQHIGRRESFADIAATVADLLGVRGTGVGKSFAAFSTGVPDPAKRDLTVPQISRA